MFILKLKKGGSSLCRSATHKDEPEKKPGMIGPIPGRLRALNPAHQAELLLN